MSKELSQEEINKGTTWLNKPDEECRCKIRRPWAHQGEYWEIIDRRGCIKHDYFATAEGRRKLFDPLLNMKMAVQALERRRDANRSAAHRRWREAE